MKKFFAVAGSFLLALGIYGPTTPVVVHAATTTAAATTVAKKTYSAQDLYGQFVIQKESYNRLWYVSPVTKKRYYVKDAAELRWLVDQLGKKLSQKDFTTVSNNPRGTLATSLRGRLIYVNAASPWYVHPTEKKLYQVSDFDALSEAAKKFGLTVIDAILRKVPMNTAQMTFDPAFNGTAYATFDGEKFGTVSYGNTILPLASLTKLMTALVLMDLSPDWNKIVSVTAEELNYPKTVVGEDVTSEVPLKTGDQVRYDDLWFSMLLASSNQAAVILVDNSGKTRKEFIELMNKKADEIGLARTRFADMTGLDVNNISTAKEISLIAQRAFSKYKIMEPSHVATYSFVVTGADGAQRTINVIDRNNSLHQFDIDAAKTGYLVEAQRNAVIKKGTTFMAVLHAFSLKQRNQIFQQLISTE